ncbi:MAG: metalloregulator ArsR/SmtB family transcription factor [Defluviitaleaceae bacterium]|nr:metalloregulator ArsR/SmtB family transcription factor [Defluviitaleaceae bacterium]
MKNDNNYFCESSAIHADVVDRVRQTMPESSDFHNLANLYKMFSDNTRLRILWALSCEEMCVCDLAALLSMSGSAISHQLKSLRLSKLVKFDKRGKVVYYSLADNHVRVIFENGFLHVIE